ncbi:hypothetical protein [Ferrovibrio sp.]|uniref:hypothetical protein n=1 Tax=Ferrovibrio sp. TaxID=1917215 RepID=UPI003D0CF981
MPRHALVFTALSVFVLAGCSTAVPVSGSARNSDETFKGNAFPGIERSGKINVTSSRGATCEGSYVYINLREGEGTLNCSDGRSGKLVFVADGLKGIGNGTLADQPVSFTIGE